MHSVLSNSINLNSSQNVIQNDDSPLFFQVSIMCFVIRDCCSNLTILFHNHRISILSSSMNIFQVKGDMFASKHINHPSIFFFQWEMLIGLVKCRQWFFFFFHGAGSIYFNTFLIKDVKSRNFPWLCTNTTVAHTGSSFPNSASTSSACLSVHNASERGK